MPDNGGNTAAPDGPPDNLATAVTEVADLAVALVRDEIALAKAELSAKLASLIRGLVVGLVAGIFLVVAVLFLLHGLAWALFSWLFSDVYWGYLTVAGGLFLLAGLAGYVAARLVKRNINPKPERAVEQARRIKDAVAEGSSQ